MRNPQKTPLRIGIYLTYWDQLNGFTSLIFMIWKLKKDTTITLRAPADLLSELKIIAARDKTDYQKLN